VRFKNRPVGTYGTSACDIEMGPYKTGDKLIFKTGEEAIVIAIGAESYQMKSLNGRGKFMVTLEELRELLG
jgi:hypothetical protein